MHHEVLIVDDEPDIRLLIDGVLRDEGYETRQAGDSDSALAAFRARRPSLAILDVWLQGSRMDGLGILQAFHREEPQVPVVIISGHGTIEMAVQAIQQGAYDFIEKPFESDRLLLCARRALEAAALARENAELRLRAGPETSLTGSGSVIANVRSQIERVAPTGSRVLIQGPAGSGKEVAARMIHARSRRAGGPFVVLNCATLAPGTVRGGVVRHRARTRSRRASAPRRRAGARAWGDVAAGRSLRHAVGDAGQDRARSAGSELRALGRLLAREGGFAGDRHHQQGSARGNRRGTVPRGSVLPAGGGAAENAGAERAARGHPAACVACSWRVRQRPRAFPPANCRPTP